MKIKYLWFYNETQWEVSHKLDNYVFKVILNTHECIQPTTNTYYVSGDR